PRVAGRRRRGRTAPALPPRSRFAPSTEPRRARPRPAPGTSRPPPAPRRRPAGPRSPRPPSRTPPAAARRSARGGSPPGWCRRRNAESAVRSGASEALSQVRCRPLRRVDVDVDAGAELEAGLDREAGGDVDVPVELVSAAGGGADPEVQLGGA